MIMAKENLFMKEAKEKGLIDSREIAFAADVTCSNGTSGRAWFFLNGSTLHLYELIGLSGIGEHVESLELKGAEVLKASSFALRTLLKLNCEGKVYTFTGFAQAKKVIEAIKESCGV